jgi:putative transcriptional regulator
VHATLEPRAKIAVVDSVRGQLLIAGPTLQDPNFWRTVVLIVEHSDEGALGLVLNRPSESTVGEAVPQLVTVADPEDEVLVGGPVGQSAVIVLADFEDPDEAALIAFDNVGVMAGGAPTDELGLGVRRARVFAGHSGWGPGQLDGELERGDWILEPAQYADAFTPEPIDLWTEVLERKGGSYALVARMPVDPTLN